MIMDNLLIICNKGFTSLFSILLDKTFDRMHIIGNPPLFFGMAHV